MKKSWLKERLTQAKQDSRLWAAFMDALQEMWDESVEPTLKRISDRKSFFTMNGEDMDTRISEYGRFFVIAEEDKSRRPMLLTQRLDEIHFKGTTRPIEQTYWREFGELPMTWEPLFAPVNLKKTPYGRFFATAREVEGAYATYGDFFLTSRARIVLDLNLLYERFGTEGRDDAIRRVQDNFASIIAPLIPLHIVFDGLTLQLIVAAYEKYDVLHYRKTSVLVDAGFNTKEKRDSIPDDIVTSVSSGRPVVVTSLPRSLDSVGVHLDAMPLDGWPLGLLNIIPPVIPPRLEADPRLYEQKVSPDDPPRLMLKTLGQFGCLVEYTNGSLARFGFPATVSYVVLQPIAGDWRKTIRKIIYLSSIDEVRYRVSVREAQDVLASRSALVSHDAINLAESEVCLSLVSSEQTGKAAFIAEHDVASLSGSTVSDKAKATDRRSVMLQGRVESKDTMTIRPMTHDKLITVSPDVKHIYSEGFLGVPRSVEPTRMRYDAVPLDQWLIDQTLMIPPIMPDNNEADPRILEMPDGAGSTNLVIDTLGQSGCLVEYANGELTRFLFPGDAVTCILMQNAKNWRRVIRKISYISSI